MEIRKLPAGHIIGLVEILDVNDGWEKLMSIVPRDCTDTENEFCKFSDEDIKLIKRSGEQQKRSCSEIFLEEWGTCGRKRPTVDMLELCLTKAELFRAADFVATKLLKKSLPIRPKQGPARLITDSEILTVTNNAPAGNTELCTTTTTTTTDLSLSICNEKTTRCEDIDTQDKLATVKYVDPNGTERITLCSIDNNQNLVEENGSHSINRISYEELKACTNNFNETLKLGCGAFGSVYRGRYNESDYAIKMLNTSENERNLLEHFRNELIVFSQQVNNHPNILPLLAISDNRVPCLIYQFMPNGSLEDRLACRRNEKLPLSWLKRTSITDDIAQGLRYLHTAFEHPIIHRDIKTSNILLDANDVAKIGDFGLVRQKKGFQTSITFTVQGTNVYMAPEAYDGTISAKMDMYSFGVVLLELLTGLPVFDEKREERALIDFIEERVDEVQDVKELLDSKAGIWNDEVVETLYNLAKDCTHNRKKLRPDITDVCIKIDALKQKLPE